MWFVNKSDKPVELLLMSKKKWLIFDPFVPMDVASEDCLHVLNRNSRIVTCKNPSKYFTNTKMSQLFIRDAGIGDLLLLEPIMRKTNENNNRNLSFLTMFPDVLMGNPFISEIFKQEIKEDIKASKKAKYNTVEDMRNYSETHPERAKLHRTDIYAKKFGIALTAEEKEPRIYFTKDDKPLLRKAKGKKYIGVCFGASHGFRSIPHTQEIINEILVDKKNIVVVFGEESDRELSKNKRVIDLQGKTSIRDAMNYIRCLDKMVSVDTGLMHIALSLHVPTVCIFSIITPDLRIRYFSGAKEVVTADVDCIGCGDFHMYACKHNAEKGKAPCQAISQKKIVDALKMLPGKYSPRFFNSEENICDKNISINISQENKLTMPIIVQDEEKNLPRFIELVMSNKAIGRVIAIDGGSKDKTVELLEKAGAEVYHHPYIKDYHEMQASQRNISCSYVKDGEKIIIMDIDECFSDELSDYLPELANSNVDYGLISRRTFNKYADTKYPKRRIKDYPDWQPRFYTWKRSFKFVGGAHHITLNTPPPVKIQKDIIHFESEGKDRSKLEKQWAKMMKGVKEYA